MSNPAAHQTVVVPGAPAIPGLTFRRFHGDADIAHLVAVREGCREADRIGPYSIAQRIPTEEEVARWLALVTAGENAMDSARDILLAQVGGHVIGYNRVNWWAEQDGTWVYLHLGYLLPAWRHRGIGRAMLRWAEAHIRTLAAARAVADHAVFGANASSSERALTSLLREEEYRPAFSLLEMDLPEAAPLAEIALPAGIAVRQPCSEQYRLMWEAICDAYQGRTTTYVPTEQDYQEFATNPHLIPALGHVAWDGGEIAGMVLCERHDELGVVAEVCVRRAWRRRGLARALLVRALLTLRAGEAQPIRLTVRASNETGARQLYESVGFRAVEEHVRYRKPLA